ncbi:MAG: M81 family metallopeptidase, partial [bacterium]
MAMRLFFGGLMTETNTFSPIPIGLSAFEREGIRRGQEVLDPDNGCDMALYAQSLG